MVLLLSLLYVVLLSATNLPGETFRHSKETYPTSIIHPVHKRGRHRRAMPPTKSEDPQFYPGKKRNLILTMLQWKEDYISAMRQKKINPFVPSKEMFAEKTSYDSPMDDSPVNWLLN